MEVVQVYDFGRIDELLAKLVAFFFSRDIWHDRWWMGGIEGVMAVAFRKALLASLLRLE